MERFRRYLAALVLGAVLVAASCSRAPEPPSPLISISKPTAASVFFEWGVNPSCIFLPDSAYVLVSPAWLEGDFAAELRQKLFERGLERYEDPANNCTKFARQAAAIAAEHYFHDPERKSGAVLAFGQFWYLKDRQSAHAINCALTGGPNTVGIIFFEPQNGRIVELTPEQIRTGIAIF